MALRECKPSPTLSIFSAVFARWQQYNYYRGQVNYLWCISFNTKVNSAFHPSVRGK